MISISWAFQLFPGFASASVGEAVDASYLQIHPEIRGTVLIHSWNSHEGVCGGFAVGDKIWTNAHCFDAEDIVHPENIRISVNGNTNYLQGVVTRLELDPNYNKARDFLFDDGDTSVPSSDVAVLHLNFPINEIKFVWGDGPNSVGDEIVFFGHCYHNYHDRPFAEPLRVTTTITEVSKNIFLANLRGYTICPADSGSPTFRIRGQQLQFTALLSSQLPFAGEQYAIFTKLREITLAWVTDLPFLNLAKR